MKRMFCIMLLCSGAMTIAQSTHAIRSSSEEYAKLRESNAKLAVTIATNKSTYLPGEEIELTIAAKNPTSESLRVLDPFRSLTSRVRILNSARPFRYQPDVAASFSVPIESLVTFAPGEERRKTFSFDRASLAIGAPEDIGQHKVILSYNNAEALFEVVEAELETAFEFLLPIARKGRNEMLGVAEPTETYQRIISVKSGQSFRLCLNLGNAPGSLEYSRFGERPGGEKRLSKLGSFFGGFRCVAESDSPITTLEATFSNDGTMLLISTSADKSTRKLYVDRQNRVIP
jgi:hypothetical protein